MEPVEQSDGDSAVDAKLCKLPGECDLLLALAVHQPIRRGFVDALFDFYFEVVLVVKTSQISICIYIF